MAMRSRVPSSGTITTIVMRPETHTAVRALCRAMNTSMKTFISGCIERELRRVSGEGM
jgi:hypothetical protein